MIHCHCDNCLAIARIPDASREEIMEIVLDPMKWLKKKRAKKYEGYVYLVTFTRNPNSRYDFTQWLYRVKKELTRSVIISCKAAIENPMENIHCHAVIECTKPVAKTLFKVFNRDYGYVDLRRITCENGVTEYIEKDMPAGEHAKSPDDLVKYWCEQFGILHLV